MTSRLDTKASPNNVKKSKSDKPETKAVANPASITTAIVSTLKIKPIKIIKIPINFKYSIKTPPLHSTIII